jgi:hypothetical protein
MNWKQYKLTPVFALVVSTVVSCAGIATVHEKPGYQADMSAKYLIFPFRNPSWKEREFPGVGIRFTNAFIIACAENGIDAVQVLTDEFQSSKDISTLNALAYAKENGADYIICGHVSKWIDRPTAWTAMRDFAGLSIVVYSVQSGKPVHNMELHQHSNVFWSGTPDDYVISLSAAAVEKLFDIEGPKRK